MTVNDVLNGVAALVQAAFPEDPAPPYTNRCPSGFTRPATLVQCGPVEVDPMTYDSISCKLTVTVTAFVTVDEYHNSHYETLVTRLEKLLGLFGAGAVPIGDRWPEVVKLSGDYGLDYAEVKAVLEWEEARRAATGSEERPLMEVFDFRALKKE